MNISSNHQDENFVKNSALFKEYCMKKKEILDFKWLESEKVGHDIGLDKAKIQWESRYFNKWKTWLNTQKNTPPSGPREV